MMFFRRQKKQTKKSPSRPHIKIRVIDSQDHEPVGTSTKGTGSQQTEELKLKTEKTAIPTKGSETKKQEDAVGSVQETESSPVIKQIINVI